MSKVGVAFRCSPPRSLSKLTSVPKRPEVESRRILVSASALYAPIWIAKGAAHGSGAASAAGAMRDAATAISRYLQFMGLSLLIVSRHIRTLASPWPLDLGAGLQGVPTKK